MVTFLLACISSCAGTRDPPAPNCGPGRAVGVGTNVVVAVGFIDDVMVFDKIVVVAVVLDGTTVPLADNGLNVPETELYPKSMISPLRSMWVAFGNLPPAPPPPPPPPVVLFVKSRTIAPALVTWIAGESTLKVQVWFQALRSNRISPSSVFRLTMAEAGLRLEVDVGFGGVMGVRVGPGD